MVYNLIENALLYAKEERIRYDSLLKGIYEPLYPKARRDMLYRRVKETLMKGCRKSVKVLDEGWKRSIAYSILMQATVCIFRYGKTTEIMTMYNALLDKLIGTH